MADIIFDPLTKRLKESPSGPDPPNEMTIAAIAAVNNRSHPILICYTGYSRIKYSLNIGVRVCTPLEMFIGQ